jgi:predicted PurR-regulated permease PerM
MKKMRLRKHSRIILIGAIVILGLYILYLTRFFILPIITAAMLAYICYPVYVFIKNKIHRPRLSAVILLIGLTLVIIIPLVWLIITLAKEILVLTNNFSIQDVSSSIASFKTYVTTSETFQISPSQFDAVISNMVLSVESGLKSSAAWVIGGITSLVFQIIFIIVFMYYFLIRGKTAYNYFEALLPLSAKSKLFFEEKLTADVKALFLGQGLMAIIQGALGAIGYLIAGLPNVLLAGFAMIVLAMLPWIGPFFVLVPAGIYLLIKGHIVAGIFLIIWSLVVSNVDNFLRPFIVRSFSKIHFLVVLVGVIVGIQAFNLIGIILGPLLISILIVLVKIYFLENKV